MRERDRRNRVFESDSLGLLANVYDDLDVCTYPWAMGSGGA
ncbi:hypothetical protein [Natrinema longum]|nr:hypothetical protein [Natrinema longum]